MWRSIRVAKLVIELAHPIHSAPSNKNSQLKTHLDSLCLKGHPDNQDMQKKPLQTLDRIEYRPTASSELSLIYR
jgi:hypothetical protein